MHQATKDESIDLGHSSSACVFKAQVNQIANSNVDDHVIHAALDASFDVI